MDNTNTLGGVIKVKVVPTIYAFKTNRVGDNCLKIGITYRSVKERMEEWKKQYPDLVLVYKREARIIDCFIRDEAIHKCLTLEMGKYRLSKKDFSKKIYFSDEFFRDVTVEDIDEAFRLIEENVKQGGKLYKLYNENHLPEVIGYLRGTKKFIPRPNQKEAIKKYEKIWKTYKKSLLNASMRYGKSYVVMECALTMDAKIVVIVSGKADVKEEWHKTVSQIANFEGFEFLDSDNLAADENAIQKKIAKGNKVAIFLTLQDLTGDVIKDKHKEVFDSKIDLIVVDESHYGARAEKYGKVLKEQLKREGLTDAQIEYELDQIDNECNDDSVVEIQKRLVAKHTIHVSGTPFRILMSGEFSEENILVNIQYSDMIEARNEWDIKNNAKEKPESEDKNPYFAFPDLLRFGFNLNESSQQKLNQLKELGKTYSLTTMFEPQSKVKDNDETYKKFIYEQEVLDWAKSIVGYKEDKNILPFLNMPEYKNSDIFSHILMVLPYRASCDAMEELIKNNTHLLEKLSEYEIINIAGVDGKKMYPTMDDVRVKIEKCAKEGKKTITLTAIRGLTGTTIKEWDSLLFLKDISSPQDYEQAIGRLFTPYIITAIHDKDNTMKINNKPQVILVDFDPNRMFRLQEEKSLIYNFNTGRKGNDNLEKRLQKDLELFPIITYNCGKIQRVTPIDIMNVVREYRSNMSIDDELKDIPVDDKMLVDKEFINIIKRFNGICCKRGLTKSAHSSSDESELDITYQHIPNEHELEKSNDKTNKKIDKKNTISKDNKKKLIEKWYAFYRNILLFVLCTDSKDIRNLNRVIEELTANDDNIYISRHLDLNIDDLKYLRDNCNLDTIHFLDYKIENVNERSNDKSMRPIDRVEIILKEFGKISDSEVVTPNDIANDLVSLLYNNAENIEDMKILDVASKRGEFAIAVYKIFVNYPNIARNMYSLPTSGIGYVLTRKVYKLLGLPVENVISDYTTFDLIGKKRNDILKMFKDMKINATLGNIPYQENFGNTGGNSANAKSIYYQFIDFAIELNPQYISMITPSRWMTKTAQGIPEAWVDMMLAQNKFRVIHDFENAAECFPTVTIEGGVNYFLWDRDYMGKCKYYYHQAQNNCVIQRYDYLDPNGAGIVIRDPQAYSIVEKINNVNNNYFFDCDKNMSGLVSPKDFFTRRPFLTSNWTDYRNQKDDEYSIKYFVNVDKERTYRWVSLDQIPKHKETKDLNKVYIPSANGSMDIILGKPFYGEPDSVCSQTFLVIGYDAVKHNLSKEECQNIIKYIYTKFFRYLVSIKKKTQNGPRDVYQFVPLQNFTSNSDIDWSKSIAEIDQQLYTKYGLTAEEIAFIESKIKPME